jgi:hypothetical protein
MSKAVLLAGFWLAASVASVALARKHAPEEALRTRAEAQVAAIVTRTAFGYATNDPVHTAGQRPG